MTTTNRLILLDEQEVKDYLGIEHTGDDTMIGRLIDQAIAKMLGPEGIDRGINKNVPHVETFDGNVRTFIVRHYPIVAVSGIVDNQGTQSDATDDATVSAELYTINYRTGEITRTQRSVPGFWSSGYQRYVVSYTGGLSAHAEWDGSIEPVLRASVRDCVADWYENTNPRVTDDAIGTGIRTTLTEKAVPERIKAVWRSFRDQ